jgi:hypothetical protein
MGINGDITFCLSKFEVKFKINNWVCIMFWINKILHDTIKNRTKYQFGMIFFQKTFVLHHLKSFKNMMMLIMFISMLSCEFNQRYSIMKNWSLKLTITFKI